MKSTSILLSFVAASISWHSVSAQALPPLEPSSAEQGQAPDAIDPEDRNHGVARISLLNGDVSVRRGDSGDSVAAAVNAPLVGQDTLVTGQSSRSEIQFDTANRVRFGFDTEGRISVLTADRFQVQIARGTLTWAVLGQGSAQGEIVTPSVTVRPVGPGSYRVAVLPDGTSQITVRAGTLEAYAQQGMERVYPGQTMLVRGGADNPEVQTIAAIGRDEWDVFNERRDRELQQSPSYNYVSRDIAGAEDLDNYGQWNNDPTYGEVWTPRVASDWAPYRLGRWGYEDYYGYTWISSDPWGWAPYHYGNWFRSSYGWSWCPGPRYSHHYYRPALVAFFGFGSGAGYGFSNGWGFGNVGWVPLAPFERYNRWYGRGFDGRYNNFGRNFAIVNNTNITNAYRNARMGNGVTALNSRDFASGHFGRYASPSGSQLQQAGMVRGQIPFAPTGNHLRFNDRQTAVQGRTDFRQTRFPTGRLMPAGGVNNGSQGTSRQYMPGPATVNAPNWNRFGNPATSVPQNSQNSFGRSQPAFSGGNGSSNWQRFGDPSASRQNFTAAPQPFSNGNGTRQVDNQRQFGRGNSQPVQVAPPVVRERQTQFSSQPTYRQPSYNAPSYRQPSYSSPAYNPPQRSQPSYSQRSSQPQYSQPSPARQSAPRQDFGRSAPASRSSASSNSGHSGNSGEHRR